MGRVPVLSVSLPFTEKGVWPLAAISNNITVTSKKPDLPIKFCIVQQ
jgi:hypothetical protein